MPFQTLTCFEITCNTCGRGDELEDHGAAHYPTLEDARRGLVDENAGDVNYQWEVTADLSTWTCPECRASKACEAEGGHDFGSWQILGTIGVRGCRRGVCQAEEQRPVTDLEKPL